MNNVHLHLVFNHLPIIFPIVGLIILLIGVFTKSEISKQNAYLIFIIGALTAVIAMATGEGAEEGIEHLQGVSEELIKTHEEAAELFAELSYLLGGLSLIALITSYKKASISKIFLWIVLATSIVALFFAQKAGVTGGEIRHTEIRSGATIQNNEKSGENTNTTEEHEDED